MQHASHTAAPPPPKLSKGAKPPPREGESAKEKLLRAMEQPRKRRNGAPLDPNGHAPAGTGKRTAAAKVTGP